MFVLPKGRTPHGLRGLKQHERKRWRRRSVSHPARVRGLKLCMYPPVFVVGNTARKVKMLNLENAAAAGSGIVYVMNQQGLKYLMIG
jgi:hypothetical protein